MATKEEIMEELLKDGVVNYQEDQVKDAAQRDWTMGYPRSK